MRDQQPEPKKNAPARAGRPGPGRARSAFAARLREATGGGSDAEIARRTGLSAVAVRRHLSGRVVSAAFVAAVAAAYGVPADWLMLGPAEGQAGPGPARGPEAQAGEVKELRSREEA